MSKVSKMGIEELLPAGPGDMIRLGGNSWKTLDVQSDRVLLLSENIIELRPYNKKFIDVTWETGTLRQYLNGEFLEKFTEEEKARILEIRVQNNKNPWFNTKGGNATKDKLFLLSLGEVVKYFGDSGRLGSRMSDTRRIDDEFNPGREAKDPEGTKSWWWLRSPGFYGLNAAYVNAGGWIYVDGNNVNLYGGIRPALWLDTTIKSEDEQKANTYEKNGSKNEAIERRSKTSDRRSKTTDRRSKITDRRDGTIERRNNTIDRRSGAMVSHERELHDLKATLKKTREVDEHMHLMFDATPFCCTLWDENLNIIECNQEAVNLFGLSDKQEYIERFLELSPPIQPCGRSTSELMKENFAKAFNDGDHRFEWMHRRPDGEPMPTEVTLIRIKYSKTYAVASYTRDLREFVMTMSKMRETDERVQLMLDATPLCCNLWDDSYNTIECNQEAVKLFKLSGKQEYLERFSELSPPFQPDGRPSSETMLENIGKAFRDGYYRFSWTHQIPDGTPIPSEITLVRVKYKDGYIVAGYTRDLREHNKMMAELELALKQATEASKAKSDFLSAMSHEMRTPMNAIIGMTSIGKKAEDVEEKNHALNKIGDASAHLLGVINDVLDMAKIEADKLELVPVEFNFERMLQKVMTVVSFRADEKQQTLTVNVDSKIPDSIIGDDQRLAQVITNLTANAVKFTPENGKVCLDISLIEEVDNICELRIEVSDSGIGISAEQQKKLFNAFEQAEGGMNREYGGTGLGLVISKNIIELMDGRIWIESELGKGSKFIFIVKVQRGEKNTCDCTSKCICIDGNQSAASGDTSGEFANKRMLLAEDVEINREILIALLEETGLIIDCAENGKEAWAMVAAAPDIYDIVFMDLQMPQMDGYEATRRIRALPALRGSDLPIVALTANVFTSDIEECITAGMDDHLSKPLDIDRILEILRKYLNKI